jgi:protocatechuate 3,4-dioxygenase beta subunit
MPPQDEYDRASLAAHPPHLHAAYRSTLGRAPALPPIAIPQGPSELTGPLFGHDRVRPGEADLTRHHAGEPVGERIIIRGRVLDEAGRAVADSLIEIWQTNAAGRYRHPRDQHPAPLDPNFTGVGRCVTDATGLFEFITIKPGAYPWGNHLNAWRPAHIHFSLFGPSFLSRLVTQMYFPGDPLLPHDPIFNALADPVARARLVAHLDLEAGRPGWALGYGFDIVLRGLAATPMEA